jgi:FixJ family two-component response regulator
MSEFSDADVQEFVVEASELLEAAEAELLHAEKSPSSTFYDAAFRAFHSIKGGAGMLGMPDLQAHMHKIESQWGALKGKGSPTRAESEYFLHAIDAGRKLLHRQSIDFNYAGPQGTAISSPPTAPAAKTRGTIYAVDDEELILENLAENLKEDGYEVHTFTHADALIHAVGRHPPDLILTDLSMPNKSGLQLLHEVKGLCPDVPVIMLSGFLTKAVLLESMREGGFYGVLEKPFKTTDLLRECWSALRHHQTMSLLRKSLHLLVYQFADLEQHLISEGKGDIASSIAQELKTLLAKQRELSKKTYPDSPR